MGDIVSFQYYIWGTGRQAQELNERCAKKLEQLDVLGYIDNDVNKCRTLFYGKRVYSPEILRNIMDVYIYISSMYKKEIIAQIEKDYPWYADRIITFPLLERTKIISRYEKSQDSEIVEIVDYLKSHNMHYFNYEFVDEYKSRKYNIEYDSIRQMFFINHKGKKMFFSRAFRNEREISEYYKLLEIEQDIRSPHRYLTETFAPPIDAVVIDAGAAEGNFALEIIDKVRKIYLFEPDEGWAEALKYTFENYKEKVIIINKGVSNYIDSRTTTIDNAVGNERIDFIKMDIEGEEYYALLGARETVLASANMQCVICTYHQEFAYCAIKQILEESGFNVDRSYGYMWYSGGNSIRAESGVLRPGVVRAKK